MLEKTMISYIMKIFNIIIYVRKNYDIIYYVNT